MNNTNQKIIEVIFPYNEKPPYVGLKITDDKIIFIFPPNYYDERKENIYTNKLDKDMAKTISILLRLLAKYREPKDINDFNSKNNSKFPIESYLWIIRDYIENGYYREYENNYKINGSGKINWKKTIKNNKVIVNNGNIIYNEFVTKQVNYNVENIITTIHKFCVKTSINIFGPIFYNLKQIKEKNEILTPQMKLYWIQTLNEEYIKTFNDQKKIRLMHMINVLQSLDEKKFNSKEFELNSKDFNYVFESLINEKFGNCDASKYNPKGEWHLLGEDETIPSSEIRPDTIYEEDDEIYVIDSKYYMYGYTKNKKDLPNTESIHKQITYAKHIKNMKDVKVYNIFMLPKNSSSDTEELKYIGFCQLEGQNKDEYDKIYTFLVDLKKLVEGKLEVNAIDLKKLVKNVLEK